MKKLIVLLAMLAGAFSASASTKALATPVSGLSKSVTFTVGSQGSSESGFPILVRLSANKPSGFSYSDCASDSSDLRFFDASGSQIPCEIDTWNPSGESLVWVKLPSVTAGTIDKATDNDAPLASAKASKIQVLAKNVGKVAYENAGSINVEAFLLNCANNAAAIESAKEDFAFDSFDPAHLPSGDDFAKKGYNGVVSIQGRQNLSSDSWGPGESGDKFFRAVLELE